MRLREALTFRDRHPEKWRQMIEAGINLIVKIRL